MFRPFVNVSICILTFVSNSKPLAYSNMTVLAVIVMMGLGDVCKSTRQLPSIKLCSVDKALSSKLYM